MADGAYLITGGLGGLGTKIARWMAERRRAASGALGSSWDSRPIAVVELADRK